MVKIVIYENFEPGTIWQNNKHKTFYKILNVVKHSDDLKLHIVYKRCTKLLPDIWVRPLWEFERKFKKINFKSDQWKLFNINKLYFSKWLSINNTTNIVYLLNNVENVKNINNFFIKNEILTTEDINLKCGFANSWRKDKLAFEYIFCIYLNKINTKLFESKFSIDNKKAKPLIFKTIVSERFFENGLNIIPAFIYEVKVKLRNKLNSLFELEEKEITFNNIDLEDNIKEILNQYYNDYLRRK
jgi:hypothetical protein